MLIGIGFLRSTAALASGVSSPSTCSARHCDSAHKTCFLGAAWLLFGVLLVGRLRLGCAGARHCAGGYRSLLLFWLRRQQVRPRMVPDAVIRVAPAHVLTSHARQHGTHSLATLVAALIVFGCSCAFFLDRRTSMHGGQSLTSSRPSPQWQRRRPARAASAGGTDKLLGSSPRLHRVDHRGGDARRPDRAAAARDDSGCWGGHASVSFALLIFSEISPKVAAPTTPTASLRRIAYILCRCCARVPFVGSSTCLLARCCGRFVLDRRAAEQNLTRKKSGRWSPRAAATCPQASHHARQPARSGAITVDDVMTPRGAKSMHGSGGHRRELRFQAGVRGSTPRAGFAGAAGQHRRRFDGQQVLHPLDRRRVGRRRPVSLLRPPYYVPSGTPLLTQLQNFQESHQRLGLVATNTVNCWIDRPGDILEKSSANSPPMRRGR